MIKLIPACLLLAGFWLSMTVASAAQQAPGKGGPVTPAHAHARQHHPTKLHRRHRAHSGKTAHTAPGHGNPEPVRRSEAKSAPIQTPNAQASHGYDPAPEFTVTPHMMLNFGVGGRL
ncbi:MAG: hypothetical protein EPN75_07940 [Beijerinckiaceae bacterium]|nr:MAG: hypothetical protein EPN75_07940 [Beijerinckiaceae bacterium]